jgi:uncharacterized protein
MTKRKPLFVSFTEMLKKALGPAVDQSAVGCLDLMSEDAVMEFPYAPAGRPKSVCGRDALQKYLESIESKFTIHFHTDPIVYRAQDSETFILEYSVSATASETGLPYEQSYISVITTEGKKIRHFKDYWNPLASPSLFPQNP